MPEHTFTQKPGDGWVECQCGNKHWGLNGAAGLFVITLDRAGRPSHVLLQHRAVWSHHGGTWAVPGGAIMDGETAQEAALREAHEEAGVTADSVTVVGQHVLDHRDWSYVTVVATAESQFDSRATDSESIEIAWVPVSELLSGSRPLLNPFEVALPQLIDLAVSASPPTA